MKTLTVITVATVLFTPILGYLIKVPTKSVDTPIVTARPQWVHLQKLMIPLFENVCETSKNPTISRLAQEFTFDASDYLKSEAINNLQNLMSNGLLPQGIIFSEYNPDHINELKIVYEVLYYARNFDAFYKAAAWARQNLNCALYVNAIYMAIQNRRDTERLSIPAPYELLPNYFVDQSVIIQASTIFSKKYDDYVVPAESIRSEGDSYVIDANYTALFYNNEDDSKLAYFREDVGLNSYYFLTKLKLAPWFNNNVNGSFGENMYQTMKQLMARYNLERYANGLPEIDGIIWESLTNVPYDPMLIYSNGDEFGHRTTLPELPENDDLSLLQTIDKNIVSVASHMHQSGYNKTQILNHLMEILVTGDRNYETLARQLLGKDLTNSGDPSVLEHFMTSLRDPMFWRINKKIVDMVDESLKILPSYTRNELYFPGVEIINVEVKKVMTAFDYFKIDVTDALKIEENGFRIKVGQPRLNHKQFTIKVNISSLVSQKGMMKIYLAPKVLPGELASKKNLFTLLDSFEINLKKGSNLITRPSDNMNHFSEDFMSLDTIRQKVEDAGFGLNSLPLKTIQSQIGYPSRLILPKGSLEGLPLQLLVFVAPYIKASLDDEYSQNSLEFNNAVLSPGYPLDLIISDRQLFGLPNAMMKFITVTQKEDSKVENYGGPGVTKSWYNIDTYDSSSKSYYNPKNGQYGKNNDYLGSMNDINIFSNEINPEERSMDSEYNIIHLNDRPYLNSKYDYSSKSQSHPFDYNVKKSQFDRKEYSAKKDYTKYRTKVKVNENTVISKPISEILSITEENDNIIPDEAGKLFNSISKTNNVNDIKSIETPKIKTEKDPIDVEPLPIPAMLKQDVEEKEKFNYKAKKIARDYKIKERKVELDKLIKDAKTKRKNKDKAINKVTVTPKTTFDTDEDLVKINLSKDSTRLDNQILNHNIFNPLDSNESLDKPDFKENSKLENKIIKEHLLEPLNKPVIISDVQNTESNIGQVTFENDSSEIDNQTTNEDFNIENSAEITDINNLKKDSVEKPIYLIEVMKNRTPTLYDYLMNSLNLLVDNTE